MNSHGEWFEWAPKPAEYPWGAAKDCFANAGLLAIERDGLTYCEGYALDGFVVHHAWVGRRRGKGR